MNNQDMTRPIVLTDPEYTALLRDGLIGIGLAPEIAASVAARRWEGMYLESALAECRGRGLILTRDDLGDFLRAHFAPLTHHADGAPIDADCYWSPRHVAAALAWATEHGRGTFTEDAPEPAASFVSLDDLVAALKSGDLLKRVGAGVTLALGFGTLQREAGTSRAEFENVLAPKFGDLLGRAMAGIDLDAVEGLERIARGDMASLPVVQVADMLAGLRDSDREVRFGAGVLLLKSLRVGLDVAGETEEDVEYLVGPQLVDLVTRAVECDPAALAELESIISSEHPAHRADRRRRSARN